MILDLSIIAKALGEPDRSSSRQGSIECQCPETIVSRAWAFIRPTSGIHDAVEIKFYRELRGIKRW